MGFCKSLHKPWNQFLWPGEIFKQIKYIKLKLLYSGFIFSQRFICYAFVYTYFLFDNVQRSTLPCSSVYRLLDCFTYKENLKFIFAVLISKKKMDKMFITFFLFEKCIISDSSVIHRQAWTFFNSYS